MGRHALRIELLKIKEKKVRYVISHLLTEIYVVYVTLLVIFFLLKTTTEKPLTNVKVNIHFCSCLMFQNRSDAWMDRKFVLCLSKIIASILIGYAVICFPKS